MKNLLIAIFVLLALTSFVYADQTCYTSRECSFTTVVYNGSEYFNGSVTNSLIKEDITYFLNEDMLQVVTDGDKISYIYNHTFNESGEYLRESLASSIPISEKITVEDFSIEEPLASSSFNTMLLFVLLAMGIIALFVSNNAKKNK